MLVNLSNHLSKNWPENQLVEAKKLFGRIEDIPFPNIDPSGDEDYIDSLADKYFKLCKEVIENSQDKVSAVHIMGEHNFTFSLVYKLLKAGIKCVASTTERKVQEVQNVKISEFTFIRFREYRLC